MFIYRTRRNASLSHTHTQIAAESLCGYSREREREDCFLTQRSVFNTTMCTKYSKGEKSAREILSFFFHPKIVIFCRKISLAFVLKPPTNFLLRTSSAHLHTRTKKTTTTKKKKKGSNQRTLFSSWR